MALGGFVQGSPILYLKAIRILMFHLSGFYCIIKLRVFLVDVLAHSFGAASYDQPLQAFQLVAAEV